MTRNEWITFYVEYLGLSLLPVGADKRPALEWSVFQDRPPVREEWESWPEGGIGIVTGTVSNLVVVDCESREDAKWFWKERGSSTAIARTRRGYHLYFRHPGEPVKNAQRVRDEAGNPRYDVRGDGGYVVAPPSPHAEGEYKWVHKLSPPEHLPVFKTEWRPESRTASRDTDKIIHDGVRYIAKIRAISGQGGHDDTYRATCILKQSGLRESEAMAALLAWNETNCEPPWSQRELLHKISDVYD